MKETSPSSLKKPPRCSQNESVHGEFVCNCQNEVPSRSFNRGWWSHTYGRINDLPRCHLRQVSFNFHSVKINWIQFNCKKKMFNCFQSDRTWSLQPGCHRNDRKKTFKVCPLNFIQVNKQNGLNRFFLKPWTHFVYWLDSRTVFSLKQPPDSKVLL